MSTAHAPLRHSVVAFTRYGHATAIITRLFPEERAGLAEGDHRVVEGDDVDPREARVTQIGQHGEVVLDLLTD